MKVEASAQGEVALAGVLAEFREALRAEIDAARRQQPSESVQLVNGRRIAQMGAGYQYEFLLETILNLPSDAPGDLHVRGRPPMEVTVIAIEAMTVRLSVPADLGPFVPSAALQSNLTYLLRALIERLETSGNNENPLPIRFEGVIYCLA